MIRQFWRIFVAISLASWMTLASGQTVIKMQALFNPADLIYKVLNQCLDEISAETKNQIQFKLLPVGSVVGPDGTLDAIGLGVLDGHFNYAPLWTGRSPAFAFITDLPGGHPTEESVFQFFYEGPGLTLLRRAYDKFNVYPVGIITPGVEAMPSLKPIRGVADLKGMKIRMATGLGAKVIQKLGASPIALPMGEAYSALEKGVVDAADLGSLSWNDDLGIHAFAKYEWYPALHSNIALDVSLNKKKWNALAPEVQKIFQDGIRECSKTYLAALRSETAKLDPKLKSQGVQVTRWNAADEQKFKDVAREVWEENARNADELAREALAAQIKWLKDHGSL